MTRPSRRWIRWAAPAVLAPILLAGCAAIPYTPEVPYVGQGPHRQMTRGHPIPPLDVLGNILSLPDKLLLWNWRFNSHAISADTEAELIRFIDAKHLPAFDDTRYQLNEYAPLRDLKALVKNHHIGWPYRLLLGLPLTLISDVLLPGRLLPWGDYYNPYTNTCHLFSDDPPILLHESGHAYDFADFPRKGLYALIRTLPLVDLYQEWRATDTAIDYYVEAGNRPMEYHAYRSLWPAYGTYVGSYFTFPFARYAFIGAGHLAAFVKVKARRAYYAEMDAVLAAPDVSSTHSPAAAAPPKP